MKGFLKSLKRQEGFTLVELMVVVAIIGLLSAVAIPNFKKYQAKAKISEAKLQLSAMYTAEAAFFSDYNMYHNCLAYMGFDPGPEAANRYFAVGFTGTPPTLNTTAYSAAINSGLNTTATTGCPYSAAVKSGNAGTASDNDATWFPAGKGVGGTIASATTFVTNTALADQGSATNMTYVMGAGGVISQDYTTAGTGNSALIINQSKVLSIVRNGF